MKYWITDTKDPEGIPESVEADTFDEAVSIFAKASSGRKGPKWNTIDVRELAGKSIRNCEVREYRLVDGTYLLDEPVPAKTKRPRDTKTAALVDEKIGATDHDRCKFFITEFGDELAKASDTSQGLLGSRLGINNDKVYAGVQIKDAVYLDLSHPVFCPQKFRQEDLEALLGDLGLLDNETNRTAVRARLNRCGATSLHFTSYRITIQRTVNVLVSAASAQEAQGLLDPVLEDGGFDLGLPLDETPWVSVSCEELPELYRSDMPRRCGEVTLYMLEHPQTLDGEGDTDEDDE